MFQLVHESPEAVSLLLLSFIDKSNWESGVTRPRRQIAPQETIPRAEVTERPIVGRCKGLLEARAACVISKIDDVART